MPIGIIFESPLMKTIENESKETQEPNATGSQSCFVASTGIEPVSGASETLILSIVRRGHKCAQIYN